MMCVYKMNIEYSQAIFKTNLLNENTISYFKNIYLLGILYSLNLFQTYTTISIMYLKHYCNSTSNGFEH
jgi:hypothetical protein